MNKQAGFGRPAASHAGRWSYVAAGLQTRSDRRYTFFNAATYSDGVSTRLP